MLTGYHHNSSLWSMLGSLMKLTNFDAIRAKILFCRTSKNQTASLKPRAHPVVRRDVFSISLTKNHMETAELHLLDT
jgi:hypothetical protein